MNEQLTDAFRYNKPVDMAIQMDADHGRIETRDCRILSADTIEDKEVLTCWPGLKTLVHLESVALES